MDRLLSEVSKVIVGNTHSSYLVLICLLARGHILIEDVPGVGKTLLATSFAKACDMSFSRVQCTPDVLPGDVLGFHMYDLNTGAKNYIKGPIMSNLILVDEINRASPKTQSALLEVMEEYCVTIDGTVYKVPDPFVVLATQNPIESVGTSPLPEAQMDRFMMRISMGYPNFQEEVQMLTQFQNQEKRPQITPVLDANDLKDAQSAVSFVHVSNDVMSYIIRLITATRNHPKIALGCSPRASLSLLHCGQANAYLNKRDYVIPDDIKALAPFVLSHRLILNVKQQGTVNSTATKEIISQLLEEISL